MFELGFSAPALGNVAGYAGSGNWPLSDFQGASDISSGTSSPA